MDGNGKAPKREDHRSRVDTALSCLDALPRVRLAIVLRKGQATTRLKYTAEMLESEESPAPDVFLHAHL
jgi:hypothetical protein